MRNDGLSRSRLDRMHDVMAGFVERGDVPGIVSLVSLHGEVHVNAIGSKTLGGTDPMRRDTIFRISSMSKPIVAAATMILVEDSILRLDDPVDRWLPELADRRVLNRLDGPIDDTVPANRPVTVRDLLTEQMGFGFIMGSPDAYPILAAVDELQLGMGPPNPASLPEPDEWMRRFATLPLMYQPGEQWMYGIGFAVLGVLIARASGQPLETLLRERIFGPLEMNDTSFSVPATKLDRLATCYTTDFETGSLELYDGVDDSQWSRPPAFPEELVSTVDDYMAFARMMLNNGRYGRERIVTEQSVELMTTDHLTPEQRAASDSVPVFLEDRDWGLGVSIYPSGGESAASRRYGWDGGLGTSWVSDPAKDLVAILMTQRLPPSSDLFNDFWTLTHDMIDD